MKHDVLSLVLMMVWGCSASAANTTTGSGDPCEGGPAEGGCGTECILNPNICAAGFYCGGTGVCTADCNDANEAFCPSGQTCNANGRCTSVTIGNPDSGTPSTDQCVDELAVIVRDFKTSHPDFEQDPFYSDIGKQNVKFLLGEDRKPVLNPDRTGQSITSEASFNQWYADVDGVNMRLEKTVPLERKEDGTLYYDTNAYFPIDGEGFGNQAVPDSANANGEHNFHFTMELHSSFTYNGGEVFTFRGDDDVYLFINGRLAIDLGGVHGPEPGTADMDALASELQITVGNTYDLDMFFAERHTDLSNFRIETSIECITSDEGVF